ncbi:GIY-YIG nuclease family protein [Kribbella qitaiheensis]|uniref:GIY-YIG nuclease family protein n=1 Tax=Kribbella qitaiheensis TaxID=1544730 RepID=UPI003605C431
MPLLLASDPRIAHASSVRQHDGVPPSDYADELAALLEPAAVLTRAEVLTRPCPVPAVSGVYAWYFDQTPPRVPVQRCHHAAAGALLYVGISPKAQLGIQLRRVGSGQRMTFGHDEAILSDWMARHARVCWVATPTPWLLESQLIRDLLLPLNLDQNKHSGFHAELTVARANQRALARELPIS